MTKKTKKVKLTAGFILIGILAITWVGSRLWAKRTDPYASLEVFFQVLQITRTHYVRDVDLNDMLENAMNAMLQKLDPYSMYMNPKSYKDLYISMEGEFGGLGVQIGITDGWLTVISPMEGTPAAAMGLQSGDYIVKIEDESTEGITIEEAVSKLRGEPGTNVTITIARRGMDKPFDVTITRDIIKLNAVSYASKLTPEIGYINFIKFSRTARQEVEQAIDSLFTHEGVKKIILDIRRNSGGYLYEGVEVSDLFLSPNKEVVQTRGRNPQSFKVYRTHEDKFIGDYPLVVLTDRGSASAAEILAGALQDWERCIIIGDTTFGKGCVQTVYPLPDSARLKLTSAYWYTPSGRCIDKYRTTLKDDEGNKKDEQLTFNTLGPRARPLYGGGAIVPDVYIPYEKMDTLVTRFRINRVFFTYAADYIAKHPNITRDFTVTDEMLNGLKELARKQNPKSDANTSNKKKAKSKNAPKIVAKGHHVNFTDEEFQKSKKGLATQLKLEIAMQKWGRGDYYYNLIFAEDPMLKKAKEILSKVEKTSGLFRFTDK